MNHRGAHGHPRIYNRSIEFDRKKLEIRVVDRMRKISRKRFIGLAMYQGFPARHAREAADLVVKHGASYREGFLLLVKAINEVIAKAVAEAKNEELNKMANGCAEMRKEKRGDERSQQSLQSSHCSARADG